jgi:hypothetical protein
VGEVTSVASTNEQRGVIGLLAAAVAVVLALGGCATGTTSSGPSSGPVAKGDASCRSPYVDWLELSGGLTCDEARKVVTTIFMGDDGNERTSFLRADFAPLPTVMVAGVGYLPTRILGSWQCRYRTRRSSYGAPAPRLVSATCRLGAAAVVMTTVAQRMSEST